MLAFYAMNVEFHYYTVYILAREAGLAENLARRIAISSQYVDTSLYPYLVDSGGQKTEMITTQNYVFWDENISTDVYIPFHFLPGDAGAGASARTDGVKNPLVVTPNGRIAKELLISAFKDKNPWLMGIAVHAFADTWAHQNFTGRDESFNHLPDAPPGLPPVAHLQALSHPDEPDRIWTDGRLVPEFASIINKCRFLDAAGKIFRYFSVFNGRKFMEEELILDKIARLWSKPRREERVLDYTIEYGMEPWNSDIWRREAGLPASLPAFRQIRHFDKLAWARAELHKYMNRGAIMEYSLPKGFENSELYHWNEAALEFRRRAHSELKKEGLL